MDTLPDPNERSWVWTRIGFAVLLFFAVLGISLISAGIFDPKPLGPKVAFYQLAQTKILSDEPRISWLQEPVITDRSTIRLKAALRDGSIDTGYGLALGSESDSVVISVSATGYLTIQRWQSDLTSGRNVSIILPWQLWPHVGRNYELNEIWIDVEVGWITGVRINREMLWEEPIPFSGFNIGLVTQGFDGTAVIDFQNLEYFSGA